MGVIKQGILGGFSGKVGTVIGSSWKGISYMRSQAQNIKNPRTEGQMKQRTKFTLALSFLKPMTELLRTGYKLYAKKQTAFNAAMSYTLANVITGEYPDYELELSNALISRGALTSATNSAVISEDGSIVVTWEDNSGIGSAKSSDKALIAVLNLDKGEAVTVSAGETRETGSQTIGVPADWEGEDVHVFLGFVSSDLKEVANSIYVGAVSVA